MEIGAVLPRFGGNSNAVADIAQEVTGQFFRHFGVVHDGRHLEIILETPYIHIGRPHRTEVVVYYQYLGVVEPLAEEIDLDTGIEHLADVGTGSPIDYLAVGTERQDDTHVHTAEGRHLECRQNGLVRQKIGSGYVDGFPRLVDGGEKRLHDGSPVGIGTGRGYLHRGTGTYPALGKIFLVVEQFFTADEIPIRHKDGLQHVHRIPLYPQMGVAPRAELRPVHITVGDINPARKPYLAVHDHYLAVVAVIQLAREPREHDRHETAYPDSHGPQPPGVAALHVPAADIIVYQTYLHPLFHLPGQQVGQTAPRFIILENVIFQMHGRYSPFDSLEQLLEFRLPVIEYLHFVPYRQERPVVIQQQGNDILIGFDGFDVLNIRVYEFAQLHPAKPAYLLEIIYLLAVENLLFPIIAAEHHVENDTDHGQQRNDEYPGKGLDRVAQIMDDDDDGGGNNHEIQRHDYAPNIGHGYHRCEHTSHNRHITLDGLTNIAIYSLNTENCRRTAARPALADTIR